ncbi:LysR family transcriptional regulator [Bacillus safensis]|uniref:helix-turn-helix domain-containing protein n=1 Tax=Bacillus safensis TaxID=561879 RepID=UPI003809F628
MSTLITFQYKVFLTVVECGSFTKAGEKLGLTQSGVSHNIEVFNAIISLLIMGRKQEDGFR